jgi:SAM-dependent methyltransferase
MSRYDAIAEWYDEVSSRWAASGPDGSASWLTRLLGPGQGWCLDLACGGGRHAAAIEGTSRRVVELELSAGQLRVGRRRGLQHLVRADVTRLPVSDASVGAVVLAYVHTDVDDVAPVFAEVERVLWPGGRLVFLGVHPCFVGHSWSTGRRRSSCTPATTRGLAARRAALLPGRAGPPRRGAAGSAGGAAQRAAGRRAAAGPGGGVRQPPRPGPRAARPRPGGLQASLCTPTTMMPPTPESPGTPAACAGHVSDYGAVGDVGSGGSTRRCWYASATSCARSRAPS